MGVVMRLVPRLFVVYILFDRGESPWRFLIPITGAQYVYPGHFYISVYHIIGVYIALMLISHYFVVVFSGNRMLSF